jgi:hypothetical protein
MKLLLLPLSVMVGCAIAVLLVAVPMLADPEHKRILVVHVTVMTSLGVAMLASSVLLHRGLAWDILATGRSFDSVAGSLRQEVFLARDLAHEAAVAASAMKADMADLKERVRILENRRG